MRDRRNALLRRTDRRRDCRCPQGTSQHGEARLEGGQSVALRRADHGGMLMEPELWQRITDLFDEAMTRGPKERTAFLEEACEGDRDLRKQVERLVKSHEKSGDFLESSAFAVAPELLTDDRAGASVGELIGHYRIESLIGLGGVGGGLLGRDARVRRELSRHPLPQRLTAD